MIQVAPLQPDSQVPLYRQLYERFRQAIETGELRHGERIPPTRELAHLAGVNRATVAAAYELLESDGLIAGHVGRGSFVRSALAGPRAEGISFSTSRPPEHLFPIDDFRRTASEVLEDPALGRILQLGAAAGYAPLKQYLLEQARAEGSAKGEDDIVITNGCQQALDLAQRVGAHPGGAVLVEDPTYAGLKNVFERQGVRLMGVPVEAAGVAPDEIERRIRREQPLALVLTPNFQNPTGATLSLDARERIARVVAQTGVLLVEIDVYRDFAYGAAAALPTIKQLLPEGAPALVLRSFSKAAFPGLRTGWVIGPKSWIARLAEAKQWSDLHADQLSQAILLRFAESGRLAKHIARMRAHGEACLKEALEGCARELPAGSVFTKPRGGMNLWVRLPEPLDAQELLPLAQREGVSYQPGRHFLVDGRRDPGALRLSFTGMPPAQVRQGLTILGRVARGEWARRKADRESAVALV